MARLEPGSSGVGSNYSGNWTSTTSSWGHEFESQLQIIIFTSSQRNKKEASNGPFLPIYKITSIEHFQ